VVSGWRLLTSGSPYGPRAGDWMRFGRFRRCAARLKSAGYRNSAMATLTHFTTRSGVYRDSTESDVSNETEIRASDERLLICRHRRTSFDIRTADISMEIGFDSIFVHTIHFKDATRIALSPLPSIEGHIRPNPLIIQQPLNRTH
jgi:hypothetical protein